MQDNNDQTSQHRFTGGKDSGHRRGSSAPFRGLEEEFDDRVTGVRSILQTQENPLIIPCIRENANQNMDQTSFAKPQSDEGIQFNDQEKYLEKLR